MQPSKFQMAHILRIRVCRPLLVPGEGFEPPTFGLQNRCTATVLTRLPF